jgi:ATPase subunit of ABC transporter with duplicated ATPase domains
MVSHDRYLLDNVVHRIVETEQGRLIDYPGNYEAFRELRAERRLAQHRAFENQQTKFKKEEPSSAGTRPGNAPSRHAAAKRVWNARSSARLSSGRWNSPRSAWSCPRQIAPATS